MGYVLIPVDQVHVVWGELELGFLKAGKVKEPVALRVVHEMLFGWGSASLGMQPLSSNSSWEEAGRRRMSRVIFMEDNIVWVQNMTAVHL